MLRILLATLLLAGTLVAFSAPSQAAACAFDLNPTNDDGVGATCRVPATPYTCSAGALAYGDPTPQASCNPPPIVCVREPCP